MFRKHETTSLEMPDWYVQFQAKVLTQLPRPSKHFTKELVEGWLKEGERLKSVLGAILLPPPEIRIWKTIKVGTYKSAVEYRAAFTATGCKIDFNSTDINKILDSITYSDKEYEIDLVRMSGEDLGLSSIYEYDYRVNCRDVYRRAHLLGLENCPADLAPALCLHCQAEPHSIGYCGLIGMLPFSQAGVISSPLERQGEVIYHYRIFKVASCMSVDKKYYMELDMERYDDSPGYNHVGGKEMWIFVKPRSN